MIRATRNWFRRNRTNIAIGAGLLGAGYLAGQYVLSKIKETRERLGDDRIARENLRRRFEQNQEDCSFTVLALLPTATENILEALPVERLTEELQQQKAEKIARSAGASDLASSAFPSSAPSVADEDGRSLTSESYVHASQLAESSIAGVSSSTRRKPRRSKLQLWNELKITSITRAFTLIYTLSLLTLLTRIQLNLLGRRNYLSSVVSLALPSRQGSTISLENHDDDNLENAYGNDFETNRRYLTFSWWLLHRGWREAMSKVEAAVKETFGPLDPRQAITLDALSELVVEVRKKVEGATEEERREQKWLPYLLPPQDQEEFVLKESGMLASSPATTPPTVQPPITSLLRRLLDETSDLIDSPSFTHVLTRILDAAFSVLVDNQISLEAYKLPPTSASTARVQEIVGSDVTAKVASVLAVFTKQAHAIGNGSGLGSVAGLNAGNEYLAAIEAVRDLEAFAAVIYSSNFESEAPELGADEPLGAAADFAATNFEKVHAPPKTSETIGGEASVIEAEGGLGKAWGTPPKTTETVGGEASLIEPEGRPEPAWETPPETTETVGGEASLIEAEGERGLEQAWEKALAKEDGITTG